MDRLRAEGHDVEMIFFKGVPNTELRFLQAQADVFVDMLTYGFFGATAREAMMLGKPVVCYLRPEWLQQMRAEIPSYVDELPVISATPDTVHDAHRPDPESRETPRDRQARQEFAVKWHSSEAAAKRFDAIYGGLLQGRSGAESFR